MPNTTNTVAATLLRIGLATISSAVVLSLAVAPALAAQQDFARNALPLVHVSDLDLTKPSDQSTLKQRLAILSRMICSDLPAKGLDNSGGFIACFSKAMSQAANTSDMLIASAKHQALLATTQ